MFGFKDWFIHSAGRSTRTIGLLLAVNLVPLLLVTAGLWDLQRVIVLYWLENGVIGLWHILRMMTAQRSALLLRLLESGFFCIHYGIFFFVHGMFVMLMLKLPVNIGNPLSLWHAIPRGSLVILMLLVCSHGYSTWWHYFHGGEYRNVRSGDLLMRPYARVIVLHLAILGTGFIALQSDAPRVMLVVLVVLKTVVDMLMHFRSHRLRQPLPVAAKKTGFNGR